MSRKTRRRTLSVTPSTLINSHRSERWFLLLWLTICVWLLICAFVVQGEYGDGYQTIVNARFLFGDSPNYYVQRGPLPAIALWPAEAIGLCKASINNAEMPWEGGLLEEAYLFQQTLRTEGAQANMRKAMSMGLQTREGELRMGELCREFAEAANDG